jgi:spermidine/putrescine transport system ATP-binding protein
MASHHCFAHSPSVQDTAPVMNHPRPEAAVELVDVSRRFGSFAALDGVSLVIRRGEFISLLGPSGCGKTTLLRLIAGLDLPDAGRILIGGHDAVELPAHRRPVNTVFQSYALFPHLSVQDNVAFGLRMKKVSSFDIAKRVAKVLEMVEITELASRKPAQLSGGQKQRVALARAIVNEPELLLLDEPLAALDLKLRRQLQTELRALQRRLGITFVFVTHDQDEALAMSDRIALLNAGRIEQLGAAANLYEQPRTRFVAQFLGSCNLLEGTVRAQHGDALRVETKLGEVLVNHPRVLPAVGHRCTLGFRPEKVVFAADGANANTFCAVIHSRIYSGAETEYEMHAAGILFKVRTLNARASDGPADGASVRVQFPPDIIVVLDD